MPKSVYNNVQDHRLLDEALVCEDVTSIELPTIAHPKTEVKASGTMGTIDLPDLSQLESMTYSIAHNNGYNSEVLSEPRVHQHECRVVRQKYNPGTSQMEPVSLKVRLTGTHVSTKKGSIESGNPFGSTEEYACSRYEEEREGKIVTLVDIFNSKLIFNGKDYYQDFSAMLD